MTHICNICKNEPKTHSFTYLFKTQNKDVYEYVFYTCIGNNKKNDTTGVIEHYNSVLTTMNPDKWIWIFNCDGFTLKHYSEIKLITKIAELIKSYGKIDAIYLVNAPSILSMVLKIVKPILGNDIYKKIKSLNVEQTINSIDLDNNNTLILHDLISVKNKK